MSEVKSYQGRSLLGAIAGLRGENLATAVLRELIHRAGPTGDAIATFFQEAVLDPSETGVAAKDVVAQTEVPSNCTISELRGQIDLRLFTSKWVIGVECKFFAPFQEGQPFKYLDALKQEWPDSAHLVVITPRERKPPVEELLKASTWPGASLKVVVRTWEDLLDCLAKAQGVVEEEHFMVSQLKAFYDECCHPFSAFVQGRNGKQDWSDVQLQWTFARAVATCLSSPWTVVRCFDRSRKLYNGCQLVLGVDAADSKAKVVGFVGFVDPSEYGIRSGDDVGMVFVVCRPEIGGRRYAGDASDACGMELVKRVNGRGSHKGIALHKERDQAVWRVPRSSLDDLQKHDVLRSTWVERLRRVFDLENEGLGMS